MSEQLVPSPVPAGGVQPHSTCEATLREKARATKPVGMEIDVYDADPGMRGEFWSEHLRCPHGVVFWYVPSFRQIATWERAS